jgi:hypothetical protein
MVVFLFTPTPLCAMLFYMEDQTIKQKMITFATSDNATGAIELLKKCRTQLTSVVSGTEFQTLVNAITLEVESNLIQRLVVAIDNIRQGEPIPD